MSEERSTTTSTRVQVTLEFDGTGPWGPTTTIDQIVRDAERGARGTLAELIRSNPRDRIRQIGEVKVLLVTTRADKP